MAYFKGVAEKYELYKYIRLNHYVTEAIWDEESGMWKVAGKNTITGETWHDECNILINGSGILKYVSVIELHGSPIANNWEQQLEVAGDSRSPRLCGNAHAQRRLEGRLRLEGQEGCSPWVRILWCPNCANHPAEYVYSLL